MDTFSLTVERPKHNPYSKRQREADVYCYCCGRGIPNRNTAYVAVTNSRHDSDVKVFQPTTE